jgi:hypothetical protein
MRERRSDAFLKEPQLLCIHKYIYELPHGKISSRHRPLALAYSAEAPGVGAHHRKARTCCTDENFLTLTNYPIRNARLCEMLIFRIQRRSCGL